MPARRRLSSTFSRAESHGNRAPSWNIKDTTPVPVSTDPAVGWSSPAMMFSSVVLPQPDAPTMQTNSPGEIRRCMSLMAATVVVPLVKLRDR